MFIMLALGQHFPVRGILYKTIYKTLIGSLWVICTMRSLPCEMMKSCNICPLAVLSVSPGMCVAACVLRIWAKGLSAGPLRPYEHSGFPQLCLIKCIIVTIMGHLHYYESFFSGSCFVYSDYLKKKRKKKKLHILTLNKLYAN